MTDRNWKWQRLHFALAAVLAVATFASVYRTWGGLDRPGLFHDEKAYLLQARVYADLKWAEPAPPVPALWEQVHVFTEPHYASRYPPGFPAVLALGAAVGKPGAVPVFLAAITAVLLFLFGARMFGTSTSFVATSLWVAAPVNIKWRAAYFSESVTCLLWLAWSWLALRYRNEGRRRDLVVVSLLAAFAALTRPATAAALAIPIPFIVWPRLREAAGRRDALIAGAVGMLLFAAVPVWNHAVLDDWRTVPYTEYSVRTYPFDMPTLSTDWSPPPRELPPDMQALGEAQSRSYEGRTFAGFPALFVGRLNEMGKASLPSGIRALRFIAPIGLLLAGGIGATALASALLLILLHITMPHDRAWTVYYVDVFPVVAFGVVLALRRWAELIVSGKPAFLSLATRAPVLTTGAGLALLVGGLTRWAPPRVDEHAWMQSEIFFRAGVCALPPGDKTVFVKPRPGASPHHSLLDNDPRWDRSDTWIVRAWDPARHRALMDAAPNRAAYLYDEKAGWFAKMQRDGTPTRDGVVNVLRVDREPGHGYRCGS